MRHQTKHATDRFHGWNRLIPDVRVGVATDETAQIPRPQIKLSGLWWRLHTKLTEIAFAFFQGLVVAAHG